MTLEETLTLLAQISLVDDRVVKVNEEEQRAQVTMWAAVLRDVPLQFAGQAVGDHYAESAYPIMPRDIAERWRIECRRRLDRHVGTFEPTLHRDVDPDDGTAYVAALRRERDRIRRGCSEPVELRALLAGSEPVAAGRPNDEYLQARAALRAARAAARTAPQKQGALT